MAQELFPSDVTINVTYFDSNIKISDCMDAEIAKDTQAAVNAGTLGWVDIQVSMTAFGFTGNAYLGGVTYRTGHDEADLTSTLRDHGMMGEALQALVEAAKTKGWEITQPQGTLALIKRSVELVFEMA